MCGAASVFWWATIRSGRPAFATVQLSSIIPRMTGKTSLRSEGRLRPGRRQQRLEVGADRSELDLSAGREPLEAGICSEGHRVASPGEPGGERREWLDVPGTPGGEQHDVSHGSAIVDGPPRERERGEQELPPGARDTERAVSAENVQVARKLYESSPDAT